VAQTGGTASGRVHARDAAPHGERGGACALARSAGRRWPRALTLSLPQQRRHGPHASAAGRRYKALLESEEDERLARTVDDLERRDQVQQRMAAITKLPVGAWRCAVCEATTERRLAHCQARRAASPPLLWGRRRWVPIPMLPPPPPPPPGRARSCSGGAPLDTGGKHTCLLRGGCVADGTA